MLANVEQIVGKQRAAVTVAVTDDKYGQVKDLICEAVSEVDAGDGVIVMTDVLGSSPSNLCRSACTGSDHVIISGVNMPMLIKLAKVRRRSLPDAARAVAETGRKYISIIN